MRPGAGPTGSRGRLKEAVLVEPGLAPYIRRWPVITKDYAELPDANPAVLAELTRIVAAGSQDEVL